MTEVVPVSRRVKLAWLLAAVLGMYAAMGDLLGTLLWAFTISPSPGVALTAALFFSIPALMVAWFVEAGV